MNVVHIIKLKLNTMFLKQGRSWGLRQVVLVDPVWNYLICMFVLFIYLFHLFTQYLSFLKFVGVQVQKLNNQM